MCDLDENADVACRLWDAASRGDAEAIVALLSPDVVLVDGGDSPIGGTYRGIEAVFDYLAHSAEVVDEMRSDVIDVFAGPTGAVVYYHVHVRRGRDVLDTDLLMIERIIGGRVVELTVVPTDRAETDRFWRKSPAP